MSQTWYSLFVPVTDAEPVIAALRSLLAAHGYATYDPFPGGTGTPPGFTHTVRLFAAPPQDGWLRLLGELDEALQIEFSAAVGHPVLSAWLTGAGGGIAVLEGGERRDDPVAFGPFLRVGVDPERLPQAFAGEVPVEAVDRAEPPAVVLGADSLPPELQQFAQQQGVDSRRASKTFERLSSSLFGRLARGGETNDGDDDDPASEQAAARAMFAGGGHDIWNSSHGQRLRAVAHVITLPGNWRVPAWETVRDAYQVHRLRQRSPRMALMPGDKEALDAVPDALDYVPVYAGRA